MYPDDSVQSWPADWWIKDEKRGSIRWSSPCKCLVTSQLENKRQGCLVGRGAAG